MFTKKKLTCPEYNQQGHYRTDPMQEVIKGKICGFSTRYIVNDDNPMKAAIVITDNELRRLLLRDKSNANIIAVEIQNSRGLKFIGISLYIPPEQRHSGGFYNNIRILNNVINQLEWVEGNNFLIATIANNSSNNILLI